MIFGRRHQDLIDEGVCSPARNFTDRRKSRKPVQQPEFRSTYKVIPRDRADTILEGEITEFNIKTLSRDVNTNVPQELQLTRLANFVWKDLGTGRILRERRNF